MTSPRWEEYPHSTRKDPVTAEEEKFQHFLFEMDDVLEDLTAEAAARGGFLTTPRDVYHKLPVIDDYGLRPVPMCPLVIFNNYVQGATKGDAQVSHPEQDPARTQQETRNLELRTGDEDDTAVCSGT